jgi:DNA repair protein SbcD/Mre11
MLRLLHTADIHLGARFPGLGKAGDRVRVIIKSTFCRIVDLALEKQVNLVLVAGDLFDSNHVSRTTADFAINELSRLGEIPVCILPGTHDFYDATSVYKNMEQQGIPKNIRLFTDSRKSYKVLENLDLTVYGKPNTSSNGRERPLANLVKMEGLTKYYIAMAHGSVLVPSKGGEDEFPIRLKDIESSNFDYVALGHWHSFYEVSQGKTKAFYCGSPEQIKFGSKDAGNVILVELAENINVEKIRVGSTVWKEIELSTEKVKSQLELNKEIEQYQGEMAILKARIGGVSPTDSDMNVSKVVQELQDKFLHLAIEDNTVTVPEDFVNLRLPKNTILGQFVEIMEEKIRTSRPQEKEKVEQALKTGYALLTGKEVF